MKRYELQLSEADEIETQYQLHSGLDSEFLPLGSEPAAVHFEVVELGHTTLIWTALNGKARWRDRLKPGHIHFAYLLSSDGEVSVSGELARRGDVNVWMPGQDADCVTDGFASSLEVSIDATMARSLDWSLGGHHLQAVPLPLLDELTAVCLAATHASRLARQLSRDSDPSGQWESQILEKAEAVLQPWLAGQSEADNAGSAYYQLVEKSEAYLDGVDFQSELSIDELARTLGVARRTLFHAYQKQLGMGPRRYLELVRLHRLRAQLKLAHAPDKTVTELANALGFPHLGRMAQSYRAHFGESPSETLARDWS